MGKNLFGMLVSLLMTGQLASASCFNESIKQGLQAITSDTQQILRMYENGQIGRAEMKMALAKEVNLVTELANSCGGFQTAEGKQISIEGHGSIQTLIKMHKEARQAKGQQIEESPSQLFIPVHGMERGR